MVSRVIERFRVAACVWSLTVVSSCSNAAVPRVTAGSPAVVGHPRHDMLAAASLQQSHCRACPLLSSVVHCLLRAMCFEWTAVVLRISRTQGACPRVTPPWCSTCCKRLVPYKLDQAVHGYIAQLGAAVMCPVMACLRAFDI
jgi:hypothetical protein